MAQGARLPAEPELATQHGVARVTVRRALDQLAQDGLIQRLAGVGTFVHATGAALPADVADPFDQLREMGLRTQVRLLSFDYVVPPAAVGEALALAGQGLAQRAVRVRRTAEGPFSHLTTHVPARIGQTYSEAELATQPLLTLLERSGLRLGTAEQSIGATLAGPDAAEPLGVEIGLPLITLERLVRDEAGRPVEHLRALYRPDRFVFGMQMQRIGPEGARRWAPKPYAGSDRQQRRSRHDP